MALQNGTAGGGRHDEAVAVGGPCSSLSERQSRFVEAFLGKCAGNATQAAIAAGAGRAGARVAGHRLLTNANVLQTIALRATRRTEVAIATADERDRLLSAIARDETAKIRDRIRAITELNKCEGRYSMTHIMKGRMTIADVIAASRRLPRDKPT